MSKACAIDARFIEGARGRLFVLLRKPVQRTGGPCVLVVPPFAEEMNKCRRMFTEVSMALAGRGIATLLVDLFGTGDSEGEFREAEWGIWQDDLSRAARWSDAEGWPVSGLLGVRLGCALAAQVASVLPRSVERTVFWQPVTSGERHMTQFLRLRVAASMMNDRKETVADLRTRLEAGDTIEVAGYQLVVGLSRKIDALVLQPLLNPAVGQLSWIEVTRDAGAPLSTPAARIVGELASASIPTEAATLVGEPFWSTTEIVTVPQLVTVTADQFAAAA